MASNKELNITTSDTLALLVSGLAHAKGHRDAVVPGIYTIEEVIRLRGTIKIGEDSEARQVNKIDPWTILCVALGKVNNETRQVIIREAQGVLDAKDAKVDKQMKEMKAAVQKDVAALKEATMIPRKGAVAVLDHKLEVIQVERIREDGIEVGDLQPSPHA